MLLIQAEMNVTEFAKKVDISKDSVQHIVSKGGKCRFKTIGKLAKALGVEPARIVL